MLWLLPQDRLVCVSENLDLSRPCKKNYLDELGGASYYTTQHSITLPVVNYHSSQCTQILFYPLPSLSKYLILHGYFKSHFSISQTNIPYGRSQNNNLFLNLYEV